MLKFASRDDGVNVFIWNILSKKKIKNKNKQNTVYILMGYPQGLHKIQKALFRWVSDSLFALILDVIWSPRRKTIFMVMIFVRPEWGQINPQCEICSVVFW